MVEKAKVARWYLVGAIASVVVGAAAVTAAAAILHVDAGSQATLRARTAGTVQTAAGRLVRALLDLSVYPDSLAGEHGHGGGDHPDWVSYGPSTTLWVPAHALVTVTIRQYDTGETIPNFYFAGVHGTVGGSATINGKTVTSVDPSNVGHTFTIHMIPSGAQPDLEVSVPLPGVPANAKAEEGGYPRPNVIRFQFVTGKAGRYVWNCEYPCGSGYAGMGGAMSTRGYMSGTLVVGSA